MQNQSKRPYKITVILSGRTNQVENPNPDGSYTFSPFGNARTSEKSAIAATRRFTPFAVARSKKLLKSKKTEV